MDKSLVATATALVVLIAAGSLLLTGMIYSGNNGNTGSQPSPLSTSGAGETGGCGCNLTLNGTLGVAISSSSGVPARYIDDNYPDGYYVLIFTASLYNFGEKPVVVKNITIASFNATPGDSLINATVVSNDFFPLTIRGGSGVTVPVYVLVYLGKGYIFANPWSKPLSGRIVFVIEANSSRISYAYLFSNPKLPPYRPRPENCLDILDVILIVKHSWENYANKTVVMQIALKNRYDKPVVVTGIYVDTIKVINTTITLNPGATYTNTYVVIEWQIDESGAWEAGTEHIVTVTYKIAGQTAEYTVSQNVTIM